MNVKPNNVLPQSMSTLATPPKPRTKRQKIVWVEDTASLCDPSSSSDDDVDVKGKEKENKKGEGLVRSLDQGPGPQSLELPPSHTILSEMVGNPEEQELIRREIIALRSRAYSGSLADSKHYYFAPTSTSFATFAETAFPITHITQGTTVSSRLTNTVSLRKIRLKFCFMRYAKAAASIVTGNPIIPMFHVVIWRDKTPAIVGTAPTLHDTDANPPVSSTLMFSRLGSTEVPQADRTMVMNPITQDLYHLYKYDRILMSDEAYPVSVFGTAQYYAQPYLKDHHIDIDLHDVKQIYAAPTDTAPVVNDVWCTVWIDNYDITAPYNMSMHITTDTEFADVQDDF